MSPEELKALYPALSDEQIREAAENLDAYLLLAWEILDDLRGRETPIDERKETAYDPDKGLSQQTSQLQT